MTTIKETHEWAKNKMEHWEDLVNETKKIAFGSTKRVVSTKKTSFETASFYGDVSIREGDIFFHFFPSANSKYNLCADHGEMVWIFSSNFIESLTEAFVGVFKHVERVFVDFVPELQSYVVRCAGFGDNLLYGGMVERVLIKLKEMYEKC